MTTPGYVLTRERATARARAGGHLQPLQRHIRRYRERLSRASAWKPLGVPLVAWVESRLGGDGRARLSYAGWRAAGLGPSDAVALALGLGAAGPGPDELGAEALALAVGGLRPT